MPNFFLNKFHINSKGKRWVIYNGEVEASKIPNEWYSWMHHTKNKIENLISLKVLKLKIILVSVLVVVAIASIPIISSSGNVEFKHALEWDFMIGVLSFYMLTFFFWRKPQSHTLSGV